MEKGKTTATLMQIANRNEVVEKAKEQLKQMGQEMARRLVEGGNVDLKVEYIYARKLKEFLDAYLGELNADVEQEIAQENYKKFEAHFAKLEVVNGSLLLDYEKDPEVVRLKKELADRQALLKTRHKQGFSKSLYDEDGAEVPFVPPKPSKAQVLKITLK